MGMINFPPWQDSLQSKVLTFPSHYFSIRIKCYVIQSVPPFFILFSFISLWVSALRMDFGIHLWASWAFTNVHLHKRLLFSKAKKAAHVRCSLSIKDGFRLWNLKSAFLALTSRGQMLRLEKGLQLHRSLYEREPISEPIYHKCFSNEFMVSILSIKCSYFVNFGPV